VENWVKNIQAAAYNGARTKIRYLEKDAKPQEVKPV